MLMREIDEGPILEAMHLLPYRMYTESARVQMLAIGLQESGLTERVQRGNGPARGLWQFERGDKQRSVDCRQWHWWWFSNYRYASLQRL